MDSNCHQIGMETLTLDLMNQRCPLALLLAKRMCANLQLEQKLKLLISDSGARNDIPRYLQQNGFIIDIQADNTHQLVIIVTKGF